MNKYMHKSGANKHKGRQKKLKDSNMGARLREKYYENINKEVSDEPKYLKSIHASNLGPTPLKPMYLLNSLRELKLDTLFPTICITIRTSYTILYNS